MHFGLFDLVYIGGALIVGLILGFLLARMLMKKFIEKNPPINADMVRAMYSQMGRKPSEKQVQQVIRSASAGYNKGKAKK